MNGQAGASYQSYYDIRTDRSVPIHSKIGQAQFLMSGYFPWQGAQGEQLLVCRFAGTIHNGSEDRELHQLQRLLQYFQNAGFEKRRGYVDPVAAREIEKEIVLRGAPYYAAGHNINPAMELLADMERSGPVFNQAERNLLLRCMFCTGDRRWTEEIAASMKEKDCSAEKLADICEELERIDLSWLGLDTMDGLQYLPTKPPGFQMSLANCEQPNTHYPPFACYPRIQLSPDSGVLMNGTLLHPVQEDWWRSDLLRVDQTYTAPHYYKRCQQSFEIADEKYALQQEPVEGEMQNRSGGLTFG